MGSGKEEKKGKTKKKTLSDHFSEEEKYWGSFDEHNSSSLPRDRDRDYLLMSAKHSQKDRIDSNEGGRNVPSRPQTDIAQNRGVALQESDTNTSRFQVDHLATLHYPSGRPQLPEESVQRMRELAASGALYSQQVYLCVASSHLAIRQFESNEVINWFPMLQISKVYALSSKTDFPNLLIVHTHDNRGSKPYIHVFGCERSSNYEIRDLLISFLNRRYSSELPHTQQMDTIEEHSSSGEEPAHPRKLSIWEKLSSRPSTKTKAQIFETGSAEVSGAVRTDKSPPSHQIGLAAAELNQQRNKANLIQKDIDLLNAALDDVELTADAVHSYVMQQRVGKKKKKGKPGPRPAEPTRPPGKAELVDAFQKSRYAINLLGKLGHHLRNPNCGEILNLLIETVKGVSDFTGGVKLVSGVNVPLLTDRAVRLMSRGLNKELRVYWNNLGTNWMLTHSSWPQTKPIPKYEAVFSNGYTPDNLPLHEPTIWGNLDPLPELERPSDYSDAYDHIQVVPTQATEKIPKDIESVVFKQAQQVKSRTDSHTDSTHSLGSNKQTPHNAPRPPSLTAALPQGNQLIVQQDYKRRSKEQLSVYRGEIVDVLEKRTDSTLVRNTLGEQGLVPAFCLSAEKQPSRKQSPTVPRKDSQPQPSSRRGSTYGIGDIPNFDPTPIPHNIPPPPPNIPPNWPHSSPVARVASPDSKLQRKSDHHLAFEGAGIIGELSKRKPLRTTKNNPKSPLSKPKDDVQSGIALKFQKEPPIAKKPKIKPITLDSPKDEVLRWLQHFSYLIAAERLRGMSGRDLITVPKEELRNICGFGEGTRLYTHLQKQDKRHQLEKVPEMNPGDAVETGGFAKFLKEHRDKVSGVSAVEEGPGPSVWQQMQASKAEAEKAERRKQKEEIWAKRRRTRELEEQADSLEPEPSLEPEHKSKNVRKGDKKQQKHRSPSDSEDRDTKGRRGRMKRTNKTYRKRHASRESSESADSDSSSETSSQYDSESSYTSSEDSDAIKEARDKKKEPVPPTSVPPPTQYPQQPTGMYTTLPPGIMPPGYPQVGYLPSAPMGMQYQELIAQQMLRQQQVAQAEQEAWNADMRLKQLRTQQSMGLPPSPTGMYGSYVSPIIGSNPSYGYHTFERNYTSII